MLKKRIKDTPTAHFPKSKKIDRRTLLNQPRELQECDTIEKQTKKNRSEVFKK